jgi:uncharacterized membrane protein
MITALFYLTFASTLGCGLIAGVFFAFSSFVMPALARLPPAQGIAAMQSINVVVLNRSFLTVYLGTAGICLVLATASLFTWSEPGAKLRLLAGASYLLGTVLVTGAGNIPLNNELGGVSPDSTDAAALWLRYVSEWTRWNSVRSLAALLAAALLTLALVRAARHLGA